MTVAALVLAAGRGDRLSESLAVVQSERTGLVEGGALPKAFVPLAGRCLLLRSLQALAASEEVDLLVPVVAREAMPRLAALEAELRKIGKLLPAVAGGAERQDSVRCGLEALPTEVTHVAVHDAARPLVRPEDVSTWDMHATATPGDLTQRQRFLRYMRFEPVDRVPLMDMGVWPETFERWHGEGLPTDLVYLAMIESGLSTRARSSVATGVDGAVNRYAGW